MLAGGVDHLAEQQAATVAELRVVLAELVPGVDHRQRLGVLPQLVPGAQLGELGALRFGRGEVEQGHGRHAGHHQPRLLDGLRLHAGGEGLTQAGEAVVEFELVEGLHGVLRQFPSIVLGIAGGRPVRPWPSWSYRSAAAPVR
ncbi:hypothetical protein D3C81_1411130 [compost metagenome]